jgi:lipopolysaccharide export LptBFGC system permease protein LptF
MEQATTTRSGQGQTTDDERSLVELTKQLSEQTTRLARMEVELAKAEVSVKAKRLGIGAGAFGGAAMVGLYALGALTAAFILALATAVDPWLAALTVTAAYGAIAGVLALLGKRKVDAGTPPVPERAIESTKQDVEHTKRSVKEARS